MTDRRVGYLVDRSQPPLVFVAARGLGEVLEHRLGELGTSGRDVSPILMESRQRLVVINLYDPAPVTVQVVQHDGQLERLTEIIGSGIGMGVLREVRRTAQELDLELSPLTARFTNRIGKEMATYTKAYALLGGDSDGKHRSLVRLLRELQEKYRRDAGHVGRDPRSNSSVLFRHMLPKAIRELERAVGEILPGWERVALKHVVEISSVLAEAFQVDGLPKAAGIARSISSLAGVSPEELRAVEPAFLEKMAELLASLKTVAADLLRITG